MHYVTDVEYVSGYKLKVVFEDKTEMVVDLKPHLDGPIFEPLKELEFFRKVEVNRDIDTIV